MTDSDGIDTFEVYRVGSTPRTKLQDLSSEDRKAKYTVLVPLENDEQVRDAKAVAIVGPDTHLIVDKNKFKAMMEQRIEQQVLKGAREMAARADRKVFMVEEAYEEKLKALRAAMEQVLRQEREAADALIVASTEEERARAKEQLRKRRNDTNAILNSPVPDKQEVSPESTQSKKQNE